VQVTVYLVRFTGTRFLRVVKIAAWTGVHGRDEEEVCRKFDGAMSARNGYFSFFQRLPEQF
jgi:hypothetical protein